MPGKWDGKSRPVNDAYRNNYDDIFKKKEKKKKTCPCGRSPIALCIGWHSLSESEYKTKLKAWKEHHNKKEK
jgi:hypothetical protein